MRPTIIAARNRFVNSNSNSNNNNPNSSEYNNNTSTSDTTPTRPSRLVRSPLQPRDHNAVMRVPLKSAPLTAKSNANMPHDKQNGARPLMPTLCATVKTANRTPLTPRVAGSTPAGASTPLPRRGARPDNSTTPMSSREDISTPVSTFLNYNITPRSSSRKSRVDNTTPTGTPDGTATPHSATNSFRIAQDPPTYGSGLGINGIDSDLPKRPSVSFSPAISELSYSRSPAQPPPTESKFFFASDAKSAVLPPPKPTLPTNPPTFFYANGDSIPPPISSTGSAVGSTIGDERSQPKFFHANGTPDVNGSSSPHFLPPRSAASTPSNVISPRLAATNPGPLMPQQRPVSPQKLNQHASLSSLRSVPVPTSPVLNRPHPGGRGQSIQSVVVARGASTEPVQRLVSHVRSASLSSQESKSAPGRKLSHETSEASPVAPVHLSASPVSMSTQGEIPEDVELAEDQDQSYLQSPTKAGHSIEQLNDLAASARTERKVLDLEITNSSLAAINRTLEREMRKQTAELRRYRRLSRSGRLSIATSASMRTSSGSLSILGKVEGSDMSDMSEVESEEDDDESSDEESVDDGSLSPRAMAESDLRHRKKDEKRLLLDLSKHQQLLIDSQKMNQSLKRCLDWSEDMINEGRKALEYHIRVSDVQLGGRVLAPDEVEDDDEGLSGFGAAILQEARKAAAQRSAWGMRKDDRDSGIELDADRGVQRGQEDTPPFSPQ